MDEIDFMKTAGKAGMGSCASYNIMDPYYYYCSMLLIVESNTVNGRRLNRRQDLQSHIHRIG